MHVSHSLHVSFFHNCCNLRGPESCESYQKKPKDELSHKQSLQYAHAYWRRPDPSAYLAEHVSLSQCFDSSLFVVGKGLDSSVVTRYWLNAVRQQPERNDIYCVSSLVSSTDSVAVHVRLAGNPDVF